MASYVASCPSQNRAHGRRDTFTSLLPVLDAWHSCRCYGLCEGIGYKCMRYYCKATYGICERIAWPVTRVGPTLRGMI